jgi:hypothetical protein
MSSAKHCPHCGEEGPVTLHVVGHQRIGVCANQHKMTQETIGALPFAHQRMTNWIARLQRGAGSVEAAHY